MIFLIAMMLQAAAAPAATPTEADIEAAMQVALAPTFDAFASCVSAGIEAAPRRGSVARAADAIVRRCARQREALVAAHAAFLDGAPLTEAQKTQSRGAWAASQRSLDRQLRAVLEGQRRQPDDD